MNVMINVDVDDLGAAERFYRDGLGLRAGRRFGEEIVEMLGASSPIYLLLKPRGTAPFPGSGTSRQYARHWTPVHLDFVVDDIEVALAKALAAGAASDAPVATFTWGRLARLADPFGHGFCLVQFLGRGYDEIAGR